MNPVKQFGLIFLFVSTALGMFFPIMIFATDDFQIPIIGIICFIVSFILLSFITRYIIKDELKTRKVNLDLSKKARLIFEFHYKQKEWVVFAKELHREERNRYFKTFIIVTCCLITFLVLLAQDDDLSVFTVFSVLIGLVWTPVFISNLLRFRNRKRIYLKETKPSIRVTNRGVIINSKIHHSFSYISSKLYDVKIENYKSKNCFFITTYHPSPGRGGVFKTSYIPIPNNERKTAIYLKELEEMTNKNCY